MTDLYFLKIFFIDKIIPYTLMTLSIAYLLLELIAPKELRFVFYDFSDRLFFKFIYRPINKLFESLKAFLIFNLRKFGDLLALREKKKIAKLHKKAEKKARKTEKKQQEAIIKNQKKEIKQKEKAAQKEQKRYNQSIKKENKMQRQLVKKQEKLQSKLETKRLKSETVYKLKLFIAYKIKKLINKKQN